MKYYSRGEPACACCGESALEFLTIDHINGGGAAHRKQIGGGGMRLYQWLKKNNYPLGFRVLCNNCNASYGTWGYCPHQTESKLIPEPTISQRTQDAVLSAAKELWVKGEYPTCEAISSLCGINICIAGKHRKKLVKQGLWPCEIIDHPHRGDTHSNAVLNAKKVNVIRKMLAHGESVFDVATQFGVSPTTIRDIQHFRTWKHIPNDDNT